MRVRRGRCAVFRSGWRLPGESGRCTYVCAYPTANTLRTPYPILQVSRQLELRAPNDEKPDGYTTPTLCRDRCYPQSRARHPMPATSCAVYKQYVLVWSLKSNGQDEVDTWTRPGGRGGQLRCPGTLLGPPSPIQSWVNGQPFRRGGSPKYGSPLVTPGESRGRASSGCPSWREHGVGRILVHVSPAGIVNLPVAGSGWNPLDE